MEAYNFETAIRPFFWVASDKTFSVCLNAGTYKPEIFEWRKDEGFEGNVRKLLKFLFIMK